MEDMKFLKVHKGGHGGRHIGNSCHVTKINLEKVWKLHTFTVLFDMYHFLYDVTNRYLHFIHLKSVPN